MKRLLLAAAFLPCLAQAQLKLYLLTGTVEQPAPGLYDVGEAFIGDVREVRFRVRNDGSVKQSVEKLLVAGSGFVIAREPTIPYIVAPGSLVDFSVRFTPRLFGSFSANLTMNSISVLLLGRTPGTLTILAEPSRALLGSASPLDFGEVVRNTHTARRVTLRNDTPAAIPLTKVQVLGEAFGGPGTVPELLGPGASTSLEITFKPPSSTAQEGWLAVNERAVRLTGMGVEPPFPKPLIVLDPATSPSGTRARVSVRFGVESPSSGNGTLSMEFEPARQGAIDDAIQFLAGGRSIPFTVETGQTAARLDGATSAEFQVGTTAGEIVFTVKIGMWSEQLRVPIGPQAVTISTASASRSSSGLEINIGAFDNTQSLSALAFTFYLKDGTPLAQGPVRLDASADFRRYFESSNLGGAFSLRVTFPVSGDASALASVEVEATNQAGPAKTARLIF